MIQLLRSENIRLKAQTDKQSGVVDNMKAQIDAINERLNVTSTK
jgi:predicted  nucleic acid-binding Zn-ribbon protein